MTTNKESLLEEINGEKSINDAISRDEETEQSDLSAGIHSAEELILQIPPTNQLRNEWLIKYGRSAEAKQLKS